MCTTHFARRPQTVYLLIYYIHTHTCKIIKIRLPNLKLPTFWTEILFCDDKIYLMNFCICGFLLVCVNYKIYNFLKSIFYVVIHTKATTLSLSMPYHYFLLI